MKATEQYFPTMLLALIDNLQNGMWNFFFTFRHYIRFDSGCIKPALCWRVATLRKQNAIDTCLTIPA